MSLFGFSRDDEGTGRFQGRPAVFKPELGGRLQRGMYARRQVIENVLDPGQQDYPLYFCGAGGITAIAAQFATVMLFGNSPRTVVDALVVSNSSAGEIDIGVTSSTIAGTRRAGQINGGLYITFPFPQVAAEVLESSETGVLALNARLWRFHVPALTPLYVPLGIRLGPPQISGGLLTRNAVIVQSNTAATTIFASLQGREYSE